MDMAADSAIERSTLTKVSWRLLPLIGLGYLASFMDRVNIGFAAPQMNAQLGFTASVYGFGAGLFFISYALLEIPSNLALARVGARRWLARIMITWGLAAMATAFVRTPLEFYAARFFLGAAEAGFFPGVIYYLSLWFPQAHRGRAITRFYIASPLASLVMGGLAGTLLGLGGHLGLAGWQWLLLVEGAPAVILSVAFLRWLPDLPATVTWLTAEERAWLEARLAADTAAIVAPDHNLLRALLRPPVLALTLANFFYLGPFYAFTLTAPAILMAATGMDAAHVGYLVALAGVAGAGAMILNGWSADRRGEAYLHTALPLLGAAAGFATLALVHTPAAGMIAYLATMAAYYAAISTFWLMPGAIAHPRAQAVTVAAVNCFGQLGSFLFPWLWGLAKDATGGYQAGLAILPAAFLISGGVLLGLRQVRRGRIVAAPA
jgi:ACS family tartrate transporter-like MFS transporter